MMCFVRWRNSNAAAITKMIKSWWCLRSPEVRAIKKPERSNEDIQVYTVASQSTGVREP